MSKLIVDSCVLINSFPCDSIHSNDSMAFNVVRNGPLTTMAAHGGEETKKSSVLRMVLPEITQFHPGAGSTCVANCAEARVPHLPSRCGARSANRGLFEAGVARGAEASKFRRPADATLSAVEPERLSCAGRPSPCSVTASAITTLPAQDSEDHQNHQTRYPVSFLPAGQALRFDIIADFTANML